MGVSILHDEHDRIATIYCNTTDWSLGPVFFDQDDGTPAGDVAQAFLTWLGDDPRTIQAYGGPKGLEGWKNEFLNLIGDAGTHQVCKGCDGEGGHYRAGRGGNHAGRGRRAECAACKGTGVSRLEPTTA